MWYVVVCLSVWAGGVGNIWLGLPYVKIFTCLISCRLRVEGLRKCNMVMGDHIVIRRLIINQLVYGFWDGGGGGGDSYD